MIQQHIKQARARRRESEIQVFTFFTFLSLQIVGHIKELKKIYFTKLQTGKGSIVKTSFFPPLSYIHMEKGFLIHMEKGWTIFRMRVAAKIGGPGLPKTLMKVFWEKKFKNVDALMFYDQRCCCCCL